MKVFSMGCALAVLVALACGTAPESAGRLAAVDLLDLPCPVETLVELDTPSVRLAGNEDESLCFRLTADSVTAGGAIMVEGLPPGVSVEAFLVTPHTRRLRGDKQATMPYFLERSDSVAATPGGSTLVYLTFHADSSAAAGTAMVSLTVGAARAQFELTVRPFRLRELQDYFFGAFCGERDISITPDQLRDLERRGFDALQFFWGSISVDLTNLDGKLAIDFSTVDRWMEQFQAAGLKGPVVWSMGNDANSHLENVLARLFDLPQAEPRTVDGKTTNFADITNPRLNALLKELMLAIRDHARQQGWPEIVFLIYDEPTERLMAEHEDRYRFLKSFWPELRIYGVTMNRIEWARDIAPMVDIFVANGDFAEIRALADSLGKPFWLYGGASSLDAAGIRHSYAWTAWASAAEASWFWAYNYGSGDLYDDLDGRLAETSARMVWPPREQGGPLVCSVSWDGMREAADDLRYVKMLEWLLDQADNELSGRIREDLRQVRSSIPTGRTVRILGGDEHDRVQQLEGRKYMVELRERVAGWIGELLRQDPQRFGDIVLR